MNAGMAFRSLPTGAKQGRCRDGKTSARLPAFRSSQPAPHWQASESALGAFGAHALKSHLGADALGWWHTGVEYQMWHGLAVLLLGLSGMPWTRTSAWLFAGGVFVFSGTLYAMALGGPTWLGAVTPIGGLAMIAGWTLLAWRALRRGPLARR